MSDPCRGAEDEFKRAPAFFVLVGRQTHGRAAYNCQPSRFRHLPRIRAVGRSYTGLRKHDGKPRKAPVLPILHSQTRDDLLAAAGNTRRAIAALYLRGRVLGDFIENGSTNRSRHLFLTAACDGETKKGQEKSAKRHERFGCTGTAGSKEPSRASKKLWNPRSLVTISPAWQPPPERAATGDP